MSQKFAIGVDLGGTHIAAALVSINGKAGKIQEIKISPEERVPDSVLSKIELLANRVISEENISREDIVGVGIDAPGFIDTSPTGRRGRGMRGYKNFSCAQSEMT